MIISSGKLLFELSSLLLILRKCCHIALVSFEFITESERDMNILSRSFHFCSASKDAGNDLALCTFT